MVNAPQSAKTSNLDKGQAVVLLVLVLGIFLLAAMAFSMDYSKLWFRRQATQAAADAACLAGAEDMMMAVSGAAVPSCSSSGGWGCFTAGTGATCTVGSNATMCKYATFNGYPGGTLTAGSPSNSVTYSFPSSVTGITKPPASLTSYPFLQVTIQENVPTVFANLLTGNKVQTVGASSTCGLVQEYEGAPIMVLNPTISGALKYSGGGILKVVGGPPRSIVVNSSSSTAVLCQPSGLIDTSQGGPNFTGSDVGTYGGPPAAPNSASCPGSAAFNPGTTGRWNWPAAPIPDPYATVAAPALMKTVTPLTKTTNAYFTVTAPEIDGCPDTAPTDYFSWSPTCSLSGANKCRGCKEYGPGYYPSGISEGANDVITFLPGVYYLDGDLSIGGSDTIRMAKPCANSQGVVNTTSGTGNCSSVTQTAGPNGGGGGGAWTWHQSDGVMFFFHGSAKPVISGASGAPVSPRVDTVPVTDLTCDGSTPPSYLGLGSSLNTDVMTAICTANGTYWDTRGDTTDSVGSIRGLLMFMDHADTGSPQLQGSGSFAYTGTLYFHSSTYATIFQVPGGTLTGALIWGNIVTDQLQITGSGALKMALNPNATTQLVKVGLFK